MRFGRRPQWMQAAGWGLGLAALGGAVWFAGQQLDADALAQVDPGTLTRIAMYVAVNLVFSTLLFHSVQTVFPAKRAIDGFTMLALICGSALLNYLPALRAGLFGRAAYLKKMHGVAFKDSAWALLIVTAVTAAVFAAVAGPWVLLRLATPDAETAHALGWVGMAVGVVAVSISLRFALANLIVGQPWWITAYWVGLRTVDLVAATVRLWLAFAAMGVSMNSVDVLVMSAASLLIRLIGLTPNGLGLSEWAIAALSVLLTPVEAGVAAAAALIDRAVEVAVVAVSGGVSIGWLMFQRRDTGEQADKPNQV